MRPVQAALALGAAAIAAASSARAAIQFQDVTADAGISYVGRSWGSAWADFDGDGRPDLWLVNHQNPPSLYVNRGDGTFTDVILQVLPPGTPLAFDAHGAIWGDVDNDGDPDLYQLTDAGSPGTIPDRFFRNDGGQLAETAAALGLDYPAGRGRMPLWLDYDRDGMLDVLHPTTRNPGTVDGPTALFHQGPGGFTDVADVVGLVPNATNTCNFALLGDLTGDGVPELITTLVGRLPEQVFDLTSVPFTDVRAAIGLPTQCCVVDAVVADLDGDLDNDLFLVSGEQAQDFVQTDASTVEAHLQGSAETGLEIETAGDLTVALYPFWSASDVHLGAAGTQPAALPFTVAAADTAAWGIAPHTPGVDKGIYVGYDPGAGAWQVLRTGPVANLVLQSPSAVTAVAPVNWSPAADVPYPDRLLVNQGGSFVEQAAAAGFTVPGSARSVVAADFDNDMDLDLYLVSTGPVENLPNLLYENQGAGTFLPVPDAGGAAGNTLGRGDAASAADFDGDGFLDLLVTNGTSKSPFELDGPTFLFRNLGNGNHWIGIDLEGGISNRDGVGCRLLLTAGGVTQLREQNGGVHYRGQNDRRVHFGLGPNPQVDELSVVWPSGVVQVLQDLPADQVLTVTEPPATGAPGPAGVPPPGVRLVAHPNPFRTATTIAFSLDDPGPVTLGVHDVAGRRTRRLIAGVVREAGESAVAWNGRDDAGRRVAAGVYFLRLETRAATTLRKIVLVD